MRASTRLRRSWQASDAGRPAHTVAASANHFIADNIRRIRFPFVSEFVFGTHNAAFVQVMYEQYLRDPQSVGDDWRNLFDNGRVADLPVIPTSREEVLRDEGRGTGDESVVVAPVATRPPSPVPRPQGLT